MAGHKELSAGPFFVVGFEGHTAPASLKKMAGSYGLGGIILFERNIEAPSQVRDLTTSLQSLSEDLPLLIGIDQEGGEKQRLKPPHFKQYPWACDVTASSARKIGSDMGKELASVGINLDFAPVLDVNTNPRNPVIGKRSYSSDPKKVAAIAREFIRGLSSHGILACGKHFPGHGDTSQDSHLTLPVVDQPLSHLISVDIWPFQDLIADEIPMFMTAHVLYPSFDPQKPATFSSKILTDLLRGQLLYEGLAITDDMGMAGAKSHADLPDACIEAFAVGCDLILIGNDFEEHEEVIAALGDAIRKSNALKIRALESLERIQNLKQTLKV